MYQTLAPSSTTMQRRDIETTKSSRGGILAIDAANADKRIRVQQTKKRLSTLREPISSARPLFAKTSQKLKSFMLALGDERLYLDHLECCEAYDHDILAEQLCDRRKRGDIDTHGRTVIFSFYFVENNLGSGDGGY